MITILFPRTRDYITKYKNQMKNMIQTITDELCLIVKRFQKGLQRNSKIYLQLMLGFEKTIELDDHIFTLFSLINKYIKKGNYSCNCLFCFQEAYDSIGWNSLQAKLERFDIKGKFLNVTTFPYNLTGRRFMFHDRHVLTLFNPSLGLKKAII